MSDDNLQVIGLAGDANVGKTDLARNALVEPHGFIPVPMAHRVKENTILFDGFDVPDVLDDKTVASRKAMQMEGTRIREEVGSEALLESFDLRLEYLRSFGFTRFVAPDLRDRVEREHIQEQYGGTVYRLTGRGGAETKETQDHWTEQFENSSVYDGVIVNEEGKLDEAIQSLQARVDNDVLSMNDSSSSMMHH